MFEILVTAVVALVVGGVAGLKILAPKTKTKTDDKVLAVLEKYGVPVAEYLQAHKK